MKLIKHMSILDKSIKKIESTLENRKEISTVYFKDGSKQIIEDDDVNYEFKNSNIDCSVSIGIEDYIPDKYKDIIPINDLSEEQKLDESLICKETSITENGEQIITTYFSDGNEVETHKSGEPFTSYFDLIKKIRKYHSNNIDDIKKCLLLCEVSFKILPYLTECYRIDKSSIPPEIPCRDFAPTLYSYIGKFEDAKKAIEKCISAKAMSKEDAENNLSLIAQNKNYTLNVLQVIKESPHFYQRNIYKTLPKIPKSWISEFLYYTPLVIREPFKNSYHLTLNNDAIKESDISI